MSFLNFRFGHGQSSSQRKNRLREVKSSVKIPHLEFFEGELEKRELLATTSFSSGMLSINLNAAGEILTLTNDGSKINISSTAAITGAGSSFSTSGVTGLNVTNSGSLAGQSFNFGVGSTFSFSQGVSISGVGSVLVNNPITATGTASISATGANTIQTAGSLSTAGGALTLKATSDIVITQPILTNGGVQTITADSDADGNGTLSLNFAIAQLQDPNPNTGNQFGASILVLPSGNVVVTSPYDDAGGTDAGAVYLFNGFTGQLISTLTGFSPNDNIGSGGLVALTNGNYVVTSLSWDNGSATDAGAVTWGNGTTGVSGTVNSTNSFVGTLTNDRIGSGGVTVLPNGCYIVCSPSSNTGSVTSTGAVTWGNGSTGVVGKVNSTNSLVGILLNDQVGSGGVTVLANGNYVVKSPLWDNSITDSGAVTWGNGATGISGAVNSLNSLVGAKASDQLGSGGVTALANGNYVIISPLWDNLVTDVGAVTWGNGTSGINGTVSSSNSLVGTKASDQVGAAGVRALTNSNYVICSPYWDNGSAVDAGAATWGNGLTGISGSISASNSLVSTLATDMVGSSGVTALTNGNYVVISPYLDNGSFRDAGAVTWGNGLTGISGSISTTNSLIGTRNLDMVGFGGPTGVTALTNGNYVVNSPWWGLGGAVTWGNGLTGISGVISSTNSLTGTVIHDDIGSGGVTALTNGNYVVNSPTWDNGTAADVGAVSWGNGLTGISGSVSSTNSIIGKVARDQIGFRGVTALANGNYVITSPDWDNGSAVDAGAVTWGNGLTGLTGSLSSTNSLVGTGASDRIGSGGVTALTNGNYVVCSPNWSMNVGAITWGNGSTGIKGGVSTTNSLTGNVANDFSGSRVTAFSGGNYVVVSPLWNNGSVADAGAVTWANGTASITGKVSTTNSTVGISASSGLIEYASCFFGLNSFFVSFAKDGSGRVLSGTQSNGFSQTSGNLNSGGGAIDLQGNLVSVQISANTSTANSITITANNLNIGVNGSLNTATTGNVAIRTRGASMNLGNGTDTATSLGLSQDELNKITAGTLTIGSNITGSISLTNNLTWSSNLVLSSNATINGTLSNANYVFTQGSNNITAVGKISITGVALAIAISAGNNQNATVGTDFANLLKVQVIDHIGNPVPNVAVTFTVNTNAASGNFASATAVKTDATGYATASKLTANTVSGVFTVTVSAAGISPLTFTLTNNPDVATSIAIVDGNNQSATVGTAFAKRLQVVAKDTYGNVVPGVSITFTAPSTGATGTFATSSTVTTNSSGLAASPLFTANTVGGVYTVTAAATGLTGLNFSLINSAGTASSLVIVDGNNQSAVIGNAFTKSLQVVVKDNYGNVVPGVSVTFTKPSTGASVTFATSSTVTTNVSGVAVSPVLTANSVVGSFFVTASTAGTSNVSFNLINNPDSTLTTVTANTTPSFFGQSVTFTATFAAATPSAGVPTGVVTFKDGTTILGSGTLNGSGVARDCPANS